VDVRAGRFVRRRHEWDASWSRGLAVIQPTVFAVPITTYLYVDKLKHGWIGDMQQRL
jgi:hypothetical protein